MIGRNVLLVLVGVSVGLSLGAFGLHVAALVTTRDWRGQIGHLTAKAGWALVMWPILRALIHIQSIPTNTDTVLFIAGIVLASVGFAFLAVDANHTIRLLVAGKAHQLGLAAVERAVGRGEELDEKGDR